MRNLLLQLIRWYQKYLAWLNGPSVCRFTPRCSEYAYQAISKHGVLQGLQLTIGRISRCHPWGQPGYDPVI